MGILRSLCEKVQTQPVIDYNPRSDMFDPLIKARGIEAAGDYMFMYAETRGAQITYHYKHIGTRQYLPIRVK